MVFGWLWSWWLWWWVVGCARRGIVVVIVCWLVPLVVVLDVSISH